MRTKVLLASALGQFPTQKARVVKDLLNRDMPEAIRLTRAGRLADATALLQHALRCKATPLATFGTGGEVTETAVGRGSRTIDALPETVEVDPRTSRGTPHMLGITAGGRSSHRAERTAQPHLPPAPTNFLERLNGVSAQPSLWARARQSPTHALEIVADSAHWLAKSYSDQAGSRAYKLYVPSFYHGQALPLIVMLHGCTQSPDDFAAGTRMNSLGEEHTCLIAYPAQAASANSSKCWNWFSPRDQQRGQGEPSLIAGITREIIHDYSVDRQRVYAAGLSAGAAAAVIMGMAYPDIYAAIGVHSGLACGAAHDLPSALAAMRQGDAAALRRSSGKTKSDALRRMVPTIVFHGDQDTTVNPCNGDQVVAQSRAAAATGLQRTVQQGRVAGGHGYSRTLYADADGHTIIEQWVVHGAGHAWSGGSSVGSFTDPQGPDASREMLRFFLENPQPLC
jgi:poly(hydroxyalkanoate) depolymerase family esterase